MRLFVRVYYFISTIESTNVNKLVCYSIPIAMTLPQNYCKL